MKIVHQQITFLILLVFLLVLGSFLHSALIIFKTRHIPKESQAKTPRPLKPKSQDDCHQCKAEKGTSPTIPMPSLSAATATANSAAERKLPR